MSLDSWKKAGWEREEREGREEGKEDIDGERKEREEIKSKQSFE